MVSKHMTTPFPVDAYVSGANCTAVVVAFSRERRTLFSYGRTWLLSNPLMYTRFLSLTTQLCVSGIDRNNHSPQNDLVQRSVKSTLKPLRDNRRVSAMSNVCYHSARFDHQPTPSPIN